jgi:phosphoglycolate phosphatase-like HAD superfamily hydrolase
VQTEYVFVDVDNTIAPQDTEGKQLPPCPGAKWFLNKLKEDGHKIVLYTGRMASFNNDKKVALHEISSYFKKHNLPFHSIWIPDKPNGIIIDDMAVPHEGNYKQTLDRFHNLLEKKKQV